MGRATAARTIAAAAMAVAACRGARRDDDPCAIAAAAHHADAAARCGAQYRLTHDPATGGREARELARRAGNRALIEQIAHEVGDRPGGADAWNGLGDDLRVAGDHAGAIAAYRRALAHRAPDDLRGRAIDAVGLYDQYASQDDLRSAMTYAAVAYQASGHLDADVRGYVLTGVAALLQDMGDLPAVEALVSEADGVIDDDSVFACYLRQLHGMVDLSRGRVALARRDLERAQQLARDHALASVVQQTALNLVDVDLAMGDVDAAAREVQSDAPGGDATNEDRAWYAHQAALVAIARGRYDDALSLATPALAGASDSSVRALEGVRGLALARLHRGPEAEAALRRAIAAAEAQRTDLDLDALKPWLLEKARAPFEDLFRLYVDEGRVEDALAVVERATARSLLDGLVGAERAPHSIADELERAGERADGLRRLAHSLRASGVTDPPDVTQVLRRLGPRHVWTYFRARDELWLIAVARDAPPLARRIGSVEDLRREVAAWRAQPDRDDLADQLGATLLPDALLPARDETLYVAIDDPIRDVTFAALRHQGRYLVERNPIAYVPSAAVLAHLVDAPAHVGAAVVVGDPRGDLPDADREAAVVGARLGVSARTGTAATRATVIGAAGASLLHVAAHTELTPLGSALVLADGSLSAGDVVDHGVAAQVVVLTSCAAADPLDRDELGPLASAFAAAGSHAVVASRWAVRDDVALWFARAFYAAGGARDPVRATRAAQQVLISKGVPVTSWATFVVLGDGASPNHDNQEAQR